MPNQLQQTNTAADLQSTLMTGVATLISGAALSVALCSAQVAASDVPGAGPPAWRGDLAPISTQDWNEARAAHLLERAGFGATTEDIRALAKLTPEQAVRRLVYFEGVPTGGLAGFDHSGVHEPGLDPFPPSRPATTRLAKEKGEALGVKIKVAGNRRLQPVVNRFFYWLRASHLETNRVAYWWANRMLNSKRPLEEKLALFWHGHFASNEAKVRDYRKMLRQVELFQRLGSGSFRELLIGVARDPAMLAFLDAGVNVKGSPNENFAREIMELFTLGVGHYSEQDIREAARAFTGWNFDGLEFRVNAAQHDDDSKAFLGRNGNFDGVAVIDIILEQPSTASFVAGKMYRFFVREELDEALEQELGSRFRDADYAIAPLLETVFRSRDFYSDATVGNHIKSPVELVVSSYRKLGLVEVPGVPDFNDITATLGQQLLRPPTVAGWAQGRSWVTPGLLIARGNFAYQLLFPDINFIPHDRFPRDPLIRGVSDKIAAGADITTATIPETDGGAMSMANVMADRDEDFNTRYASFKGWQRAISRVKPIVRNTAQLDLVGVVFDAGLATTAEAVDYFLARMLQVPIDGDRRNQLVELLDAQLGTSDLERAASYLEEPLRELLHLIMSAPEYQLG